MHDKERKYGAIKRKDKNRKQRTINRYIQDNKMNLGQRIEYRTKRRLWTMHGNTGQERASRTMRGNTRQ
jgi:predicted solute-binding protein